MMIASSLHIFERGSSQPRHLERKRLLVAVVTALLLGTAVQAAQAQQGQDGMGFLDSIDTSGIANNGIVSNSSVLGGSVLSNIRGISTTNMAAGDGNLQSNSGTVAIGNVASTANTLVQQIRIEEGLADRQDSVRIQDRAFRQAQGWMSINQAAGQGNVQSNTFAVSLGISASNLNDVTLQQVFADKHGLKGSDDTSDESSRRVEIDKTTFEGARGVIQVNQSAGMGNATRNSFRMNMALGQ